MKMRLGGTDYTLLESVSAVTSRSWEVHVNVLGAGKEGAATLLHSTKPIRFSAPGTHYPALKRSYIAAGKWIVDHYWTSQESSSADEQGRDVQDVGAG